MNDTAPHSFGYVDLQGEHGLFRIASGRGTACVLQLVSRTERGYPRRELACIPAAVWRKVASAVQKDFRLEMDEEEVEKKAPTFKTGENALSPLVTRELAVLLWALVEDGEGTHTDTLLSGWRQLAREERWWLYARASDPAQKQGVGWRRALFFALTDPADTRTAPRLLEIMETAAAQKKTSGSKPPATYKIPRKNRKKTTVRESKPSPSPATKKKQARKRPKKTSSRTSRQSSN